MFVLHEGGDVIEDFVCMRLIKIVCGTCKVGFDGCEVRHDDILVATHKRVGRDNLDIYLLSIRVVQLRFNYLDLGLVVDQDRDLLWPNAFVD